MRLRLISSIAFITGFASLCVFSTYAAAGQLTDPTFDASVPAPAYSTVHPKVLFDEAHFNVGSTYLCEGNYEKAIEHYQKAITLDPNYDIAWEGLADAKRALEIREQSK